MSFEPPSNMAKPTVCNKITGFGSQYNLVENKILADKGNDGKYGYSGN